MMILDSEHRKAGRFRSPADREVRREHYPPGYAVYMVWFLVSVSWAEKERQDGIYRCDSGRKWILPAQLGLDMRGASLMMQT